MTGFPIGTISDLSHVASLSILLPHSLSQWKVWKKGLASPSDHDGGGFLSLYPNYGPMQELQDEPHSNVKLTDGIAACPLNRLRTRLSIPFGFLHAASTHLYVSLWWRLKRFVPSILRKLSKYSLLPSDSKSGGEWLSQLWPRGRLWGFQIYTYASSLSLCASLLQPSMHGDKRE